MRRETTGLLCVLISVAACHRTEPPSLLAFEHDASVAPLPPPANTASAASAVSAPAATPTMPDRKASADAGPDPGTLPQTRDKPQAGGPAFDGRVAALWEAIVRDEPDLAISAFFPVTAYEQVKAITNPASDWRRRLVAAFKRDVHALHKRLAERGRDAKFVRIDVPPDRARWVEPNEESNKLGYWRVYGSTLIYEIDGKEKKFEISSLISWRGEWYVVHLSGFK
jgi:hypothetical protein